MNRRPSLVRAAALVAALAIAAPVAAQPAPAAPKKAAPAAAPAKAPTKAPGAFKLPAVETWRLDNGMQVAFLRVDTAPVVAVEVWYHVGSKDEPRNRRGSAHMFEHMMFKGSKRVRGEEHARHLNRLGGYVNAATSEDATHYINVLPSRYLDFGVQLEAERMRNLLFRPDMVATEREVVKEEIRQQENNPLAKGLLRFLEIAFTKHPYAWTAGGNIADLDATTPDELKKFYDAYYQPSNALLVVVGAVDRADVEAVATKHFGAIAAAPAPARPADAAAEPAQTALRREVVESGQVGVVFLGYEIPEAKHADIYALQVLSLVLGTGESSRLARRIKVPDPKTKKALGVEAGSPALVREHPGLLVMFGAYLEAGDGTAIEAALQDEAAKLAATAPSAEEVRKVKNQIQAGFVFSLQSASGLAEQIGMSWILTGDATQFLRDLDEIEKVTPADVQRVAKTYLRPENATIVVVPPPGAAK